MYEENISSTLNELKADFQNQECREFNALRNESKSTSQEIKKFLQEFSEVDELRKRRASIHKKNTCIESEIENLKQIENRFAVQETNSISNQKKSEVKLNVANKLDFDLKNLKEHNDQDEISRINPTMEKTKEIEEKNAKYIKNIEDVQQKLCVDEEKHRMEINKKKESIALMQIDMEKIEHDINKMKEEHKCVQLRIKEEKAHLEHELATNEELGNKFVKAIRAEELRKKEKLNKRQLKKDQRKKEVDEKWKLEQSHLIFKIRLYQAATELVEKTNQIVLRTIT